MGAAVMADSRYRDLADAIILQAVTDYRRAYWKLRRCKHHQEALETITECEQFFQSTWFSMLCDLDGEKLLRDVKREMKLQEGCL